MRSEHKHNYLDILTPPELIAFLRHLELGDAHLKDYLSPSEYEQLLDLETLDPKTAEQLDADKAELAGNVALVTNSFFTATVGFWIGVHGFLGRNLRPTTLAIILVLAATGGAFVGFQNYKFIRKLGEASIRKSKLQALQMDILNRVIDNRKKEIQEKTTELKENLQKLNFSFPFAGGPEWIEKFETGLEKSFLPFKEKGAYRVFAKEIEEARHHLQQSLTKPEREGFLPIFRKLTQQGKGTIPRAPWLQTNLRNIGISIIPILFGAFGSVLFHFSNAPTIAKGFEQYHLHQILSDPKIKPIEFITSLFITLYFLFTNLYSNFKAFLRSRKYDENEEILIKKRDQMHQLDDQLLKIKEAHTHIVRLATLFEHVKQLTPKIH